MGLIAVKLPKLNITTLYPLFNNIHSGDLVANKYFIVDMK
jgi:hypothetical protein